MIKQLGGAELAAIVAKSTITTRHTLDYGWELQQHFGPATGSPVGRRGRQKHPKKPRIPAQLRKSALKRWLVIERKYQGKSAEAQDQIRDIRAEIARYVV
jgi:hypothetical protein